LDNKDAMNFRELQAFSGCTVCPPGATTPAGSTAAAACACRAGGFGETGVMNGPDSARTYSSKYEDLPVSSKLDGLFHFMAWVVKDTALSSGQYMEIDAGQPMLIAGIITQGRGETAFNAQYVKQFTIEYRLGDSLGTGVALLGSFSAADRFKKEHLFVTPIYARYIRIVVMA